LQNRLAKETASLIPAAAIKAGLPAANVTALMAQLTSATFAEDYSAAVVSAVATANVKAYESSLS
jgi:hypothetical protein